MQVIPDKVTPWFEEVQNSTQSYACLIMLKDRIETAFTKKWKVIKNKVKNYKLRKSFQEPLVKIDLYIIGCECLLFKPFEAKLYKKKHYIQSL